MTGRRIGGCSDSSLSPKEKAEARKEIASLWSVMRFLLPTRSHWVPITRGITSFASWPGRWLCNPRQSEARFPVEFFEWPRGTRVWLVVLFLYSITTNLLPCINIVPDISRASLSIKQGSRGRILAPLFPSLRALRGVSNRCLVGSSYPRVFVFLCDCAHPSNGFQLNLSRNPSKSSTTTYPFEPFDLVRLLVLAMSGMAVTHNGFSISFTPEASDRARVGSQSRESPVMTPVLAKHYPGPSIGETDFLELAKWVVLPIVYNQDSDGNCLILLDILLAK